MGERVITGAVINNGTLLMQKSDGALTVGSSHAIAPSPKRRTIEKRQA